MNLELVYNYPVWYIPLCFIVGLAYAFFLYRKNHGIPETSKWFVRLLFALRATVVSILCFLLFAPLLRINTRELEKPIILFLQDNSESIASTRDSAFYRNEYPNLVEKLSSGFSDEFEFKRFAFDTELLDSFALDFKGKETDISLGLNRLYDLYENQNVGAVILSTDGIYNKGKTPLYLSRNLRAPIYTVALGDTAIQRDLLIKQVLQNQLAYLNNTFPINVAVQGQKLQGRSSKITIKRDNELIAEQQFTIDQDSYLSTFPFQIKADKVGIQKFRIAINPVEGEFTLNNNYKDIFIEVIDSRQKVLLLASNPHPDVAAIRQSLEANQNYEVVVGTPENFTSSVKGYSLIIFHQIPSITNTAGKIHQEALNEKIPLWYIAGASTLTGALNAQQKLMQINGGRGGMSDVFGNLNKSFALFTLSDELRNSIASFGPLQVPNGNYTISTSAIPLLTQRIGAVTTQYPLFVFSADPENKSALLAGEGLWRWRMQDFAERGNHMLFDELISKTVQYLSVRNERRNLRIIAKNSYNDNERIRFDAEVYNSSFELINSVDVNLEITGEDGNTYPYSFARTSTAYTLDLGLFRAGSYSYSAKAKVGEKEFTSSGRFIVKPITSERSSGQADHAMLNTLSERSGGEMISPSNMLSLLDIISKRSDVKPVSHVESKLIELVKFPWIFALLLFLLSLEWFLRKRSGSY
ncbi:MAG: hypothetical protein WED33_08855 [Bacteroidia bacterium]